MIEARVAKKVVSYEKEIEKVLFFYRPRLRIIGDKTLNRNENHKIETFILFEFRVFFAGERRIA